jgi:hypothetical protein
MPGLGLTWAVGIAVVLLAAPACGPQGPRRITIKGSATLDGKPIEFGEVMFVPTDPAAASAGGRITDGAFSVAVFKGPHRVQIMATRVQPRSGGSGEGGYELIPGNIIPRRYNDNTTLTFDVQGAKDQPKFDLVSDAKAK